MLSKTIGPLIRASDFRARYGGQIVAIEEPDDSIQCPPDLDRPLESRHRLLAIMADATPQPKGRAGQDTGRSSD